MSGHEPSFAASSRIATPREPLPLDRLRGPQPRTHRMHLQIREEANPFVRHHVIGRHAVLPAAAVISRITGECEALHPGFKFFRAERFRAFKGIVFDDSLRNPYVLDLIETSGGGQPFVLFEAALWHMGPRGRPRYNYSGAFTLRQRIPPPPTHPFGGPFPLQDGPATCYQDGTLFHGPLFAGVQKILKMDKEGLVLECCSPSVAKRDQGQFPVNTFNLYTADVAVQSVVIWARNAYGAAGLPTGFATAEQFRPVPFEETYYVSVDVKSSGPRHVKANVTQHDEQGFVYSRLLGGEAPLNRGLNALFAEGAKSHL